MLEAGILTEDDRLELIDGEIVEMSPIGSSHQGCVDRLNFLFVQRAGDKGIVRIQGPIELDDFSEPQPDLSLLRMRSDYYSHSHPRPADVLLVVEVSDSTLDYDRSVKIPLYARAGVAEAWVANLSGDSIEVYSDPANGSYQRVRICRRGESISPRDLQHVSFIVDEILG